MKVIDLFNLVYKAAASSEYKKGPIPYLNTNARIFTRFSRNISYEIMCHYYICPAKKPVIYENYLERIARRNNFCVIVNETHG